MKCSSCFPRLAACQSPTSHRALAAWTRYHGTDRGCCRPGHYGRLLTDSIQARPGNGIACHGWARCHRPVAAAARPACPRAAPGTGVGCARRRRGSPRHRPRAARRRLRQPRRHHRALRRGPAPRDHPDGLWAALDDVKTASREATDALRRMLTVLRDEHTSPTPGAVATVLRELWATYRFPKPLSSATSPRAFGSRSARPAAPASPSISTSMLSAQTRTSPKPPR